MFMPLILLMMRPYTSFVGKAPNRMRCMCGCLDTSRLDAEHVGYAAHPAGGMATVCRLCSNVPA